jgi:putative hydrolase of the HAD superfamily
MNEYKNIIFDLGNVLLPIDFNAPVNAFRKIGLQDFEGMYSGINQSNLFDLLETGKISDLYFYDKMREISGYNWSNQEINDAWTKIILDFRPSTIEMLESLAKTKRLFLLSNTNKIHFDVYDAQIRERFNPEGLSSYFEKAFYSHEMGLRKPDPQIFISMAEIAGIKPSESLFVDDNEDNITTATKLGFCTYLLKPETLVESLFD